MDLIVTYVSVEILLLVILKGLPYIRFVLSFLDRNLFHKTPAKWSSLTIMLVCWSKLTESVVSLNLRSPVVFRVRSPTGKFYHVGDTPRQTVLS